MIVAAALGVAAGMLVGLGVAWLIAWAEDRRVEPVELDDSYRRLDSQIRGRIP